MTGGGFVGAPPTTDMRAVGIGYTLATGRLFCAIPDFHRWVEELLGRPVFTHEMGDAQWWADARTAFEEQVLAERSAVGASTAAEGAGRDTPPETTQP